MISKSGEKGHGEEEAATGRISEAVFHRDAVPGVSGISTMVSWICLPPVRLPARIPALQRAVPMYPMQTPDLRDGRNGAAQDPYAAENLVPGLLPGLRR